MPLPEVILNKPELIPGLDFYYKAFWDLTADRLAGAGGASMIKWTAMKEYATMNGITDLDEFERFKSLLCYLDITYLDHLRSKEKK